MHRSITFFCVILISLLLTESSSIAQIPFTQHTIATSLNGACSIHATDVNGDSIVDVICAGWDASTIAWWQNDGGSPITWERHNITTNFPGACDVFAIDIDNDNDTDVLGAAWTGNEIAWWENDGSDPPQWTKHTLDANFNDAHEVHAADIDNDNDIDVLGASAANHEIALWLNDGNIPITWTKQKIDSTFYGARSVYAVDINGDNIKDVVGAAFLTHQITWWHNDGNIPINWTEYAISDTFNGAHMVYACDLDGDTDNDVVAAGYYENAIIWWRNDGSTPVEWTEFPVDLAFSGALGVYATDMDGDGDNDVLGAAESAADITLWLNIGFEPIQWTEQTINGAYYGAWPIYATDVDGDDDVDVLATSSSLHRVNWWENTSASNVDDNPHTPEDIRLLHAFPNPFNPKTNLTFEIPLSNHISLIIYNIDGQEVARLADGWFVPGIYQLTFDGTQLPSGLYFARLKANNIDQVQKILLLK